MKPLVIEDTKYSPRVELNPTGEIFIKGRSLIEDPLAFYTPIFSWVENCTTSSLKVDIKLEYLNTSSSKQIFNLLLLIRDNSNFKNVSISWFYEEGDEDSYELGKEFEEQVRLPFEFFEYSEVA